MGLLASNRGVAVPLDNHLRQLIEILGVRAVGFAGLLANRVPTVQHWVSANGSAKGPESWPWEEWPERLGELLESPGAVPLVTRRGKTYLLTATTQQEGTSWLLWLEVDGPRDWSVTERSGLALAGLSLVRLLSSPASPGAAGSPRRSSDSRIGWLEVARRQQRLEAAAAMIAQVAHDFNNVLTSIVGFIELSLAKVPPQEPGHRLLSDAHVAATKGSELVAKLGLLSKCPAPSTSRATLARALANQESRARTAGKRDGFVVVDLPEDLPTLAMDPGFLDLLLTQLLNNAREAVADSGSIELSARRVELTRFDCVNLLGNATPGPHVEIAVSDTGAGLRPEARQRIFLDPFFSTKPCHRGLGGLATVYGIARAYRGGVRLEEEAEGRTVARFYVPEAATEAATIALRRPSREIPAAVPASHGAGDRTK
jgi:signal transduction histidine kinase